MCSTRQSIEARAYTKRNKLLSIGHNSYTKTHPLQKYFAERVGHPHKEFLHAELDAILKARDKPIHTLVVTRHNKKGEIRNAKPCSICRLAIKAFDITNVIYSTNKGIFDVLET